MDCEQEFDAARLAAVEALILVYETAIVAVSVDGKSSYSFDDGQTRQTVTRHNLTELENKLQSALNRRATLLAAYGRGQAYVRPGF